MKKQFGGTIIGFIIGVVVGLGAALAVAVYVTKVPVPFINKGQSRTADHDEAEAKKNKDWDPNAPLYGKNPSRPAPVASGAIGIAPAVPPTAATPAAAASTARPAASVAARPATPSPAASNDPLGDLAKSRAAASPQPSAAAAAAIAAGAEPFTYFVQVGAYRSMEDAEAQRVKLSLTGVETKITEREQSGRTVFRVRAGPFEKKDDADRLKERLDGTGLETALVRVQR